MQNNNAIFLERPNKEKNFVDSLVGAEKLVCHPNNTNSLWKGGAKTNSPRGKQGQENCKLPDQKHQQIFYTVKNSLLGRNQQEMTSFLQQKHFFNKILAAIFP